MNLKCKSRERLHIPVRSLFYALTMSARTRTSWLSTNTTHGGITVYIPGQGLTSRKICRKAKSLDVQKLQAHKLNMGSKALKGRYANAFKNTTKLEICRLLYNANAWLRYGIFASLISSGLSGWY